MEARAIKASAWAMLGTALAYLLIQGPAFALLTASERTIERDEKPWALAGLIFSLLGLAIYLIWQFKVASDGNKHQEKIASLFMI